MAKYTTTEMFYSFPKGVRGFTVFVKYHPHDDGSVCCLVEGFDWDKPKNIDVKVLYTETLS